MIEGDPLRFRIPEPPARPGERADFSYLVVPAAGSVSRPAVDTDPSDMRDLAYTMIRVLDDDGSATGPWVPQVEPDALYQGLRAMMMTRAFDDRMLMAQRQGKTSFYMQLHRRGGGRRRARRWRCDRATCASRPIASRACCIARRWPLVEMMCQVFSNERDRLKGRQMPIMYSAREAGLLLDLGQPRHAVHPGGRLGDGLGDQGRHADRIGRGSAKARPPRPTSTTR